MNTISFCRMLFIILTLELMAAAQTTAPAIPATGDFESSNPAVRATALAVVRTMLNNNPRTAVATIQRARVLDSALKAGENDLVAGIALRCINAQPDRLDRAELFLSVRIKALLAANRSDEALIAAKSFYNVVPLNSSGKAIDFVAQALAAAYPNDPAKVKRFKLQQLAGSTMLTTGDSTTQPSNSPYGESVLASIKVDESIYDGHGLFDEHNADWQWVGQGNLLLMKDKPAQAKAIFEKLLKVDNIQIREAAQESLARCAKAEAGCVGPGNQVLISFRQAATQP